MATQGENRTGPQSRDWSVEGRDLLVGRPGQEAVDKSATKAERSPRSLPSLEGDAHAEALREILATVRATAARIDALQAVPTPNLEAAEALARETAALIQAVTDARGALAKAAELAAGRDGAAEAARALAGAAAALKTQGEALDQRIRATNRQSVVAAHSMADMNQSATALNDQLRTLGNDLLRTSDRLRWRHWRFGLAVAAASFIFFALGAVLQREADVMSFGDPRQAWNDFVAEHYAPTLAACASEARSGNVIIGCRIRIYPSLAVTIPLYPDITLTDVPPEEQDDPEAEQ